MTTQNKTDSINNINESSSHDPIETKGENIYSSTDSSDESEEELEDDPDPEVENDRKNKNGSDMVLILTQIFILVFCCCVMICFIYYWIIYRRNGGSFRPKYSVKNNIVTVVVNSRESRSQLQSQLQSRSQSQSRLKQLSNTYSQNVNINDDGDDFRFAIDVLRMERVGTMSVDADILNDHDTVTRCGNNNDDIADGNGNENDDINTNDNNDNDDAEIGSIVHVTEGDDWTESSDGEEEEIEGVRDEDRRQTIGIKISPNVSNEAMARIRMVKNNSNINIKRNNSNFDINITDHNNKQVTQLQPIGMTKR